MRSVRSSVGRTCAGLTIFSTIVVLVAGGLGAPVAWAQDAPASPTPYQADVDLTALAGSILIDGSSTVWPITASVVNRFRDLAPAVITHTQISGTTGGFSRFCFGASDIQNASRPITDAETAACAANGVSYLTLEIGYDGITVVVNPSVSFADCLRVEQLRRLWEPGSTVHSWRDLDPTWPDQTIALFGPGSNSGTFDYFTQAIVGQTDASRKDFVASEDDTVLVNGVASTPFALGYFGYAYYVDRQHDLKALAVDNGQGCVGPTPQTIADNTYAPLSRPLFVYVNLRALARPEVRELMRFYVAVAPQVVADVGYVPVPQTIYADDQTQLDQAISASQATPSP
jgi:phosphate transport system substrate-binding protein